MAREKTFGPSFTRSNKVVFSVNVMSLCCGVESASEMAIVIILSPSRTGR